MKDFYYRLTTERYNPETFLKAVHIDIDNTKLSTVLSVMLLQTKILNSYSAVSFFY